MGGFRSKLVKGSTYIFISGVIGTLCAIFHSIIVARLLNDPDALGVLSILSSLQGMFTSFALFGIPMGIAKFIAEYRVKDKNTMNHFLSNGFILMLLLSLIVSITFFLLSEVIAINLYERPILILLIRISAVTIIVSTAVAFFSAVLQGFQEMKRLALLNILKALINLPILYILVLSYHLVGVVVALLLDALISLVIGLTMIRNVAKDENIRFDFHIERRHLFTLLSFSLPIFLSGFIFSPIDWFSRTYLALTYSFGEVGLFKLGYGLYNLFLLLPGVVVIPLMPMISELYASRSDTTSITISKILRIVMLLMLPITVGVGIASKFFILVMYGETYVDAWAITYIMLLTAFFASLISITSSMLMGTGRTWQIFGIDLLWRVGLFLPLSYFLIPTHSLIGLGVAHLVSTVIIVMVVLAYFAKKFNMELAGLRVPFALTSVFMLASYIVLRTTQGTTLLILDLIIVGLLLPIEYIILTPEERKMIIKSIREAVHMK